MSTVMTGSWLNELKGDGREAFDQLGYPTTALEEWRFTNVSALAKLSFVPGPATLPGLTAAALDALTFPRQLAAGPSGAGATGAVPATSAVPATLRVVAVNGRWSRELSDDLSGLPAGVRLMSLAEALDKRGEELRPHLGRMAKVDDHPFRALNTAELADGFYLHVPADTVIDTPIHLLHVGSSAGGAPAASHPRTLIVLGRNAQATVVEGFVGFGSGAYLTNSVSECELGEGATLDHYRLQEESPEAYHMSSLYAHQAADSNFYTHAFLLGGLLNRNDVGTMLDGPGAEGTLNGLYVIGDQQHVDNHTMIDHAKPHCHSFEVYKGILDGQARGVFNGRILVRKDAQKTDSKQTNKNLLVSNEALVNTNPQLEIYADDVKCTHGATIGQLDPEQIFYLQSRGIGAEAARWMLTYAFAIDLVSRIKVPALRERLDDLFAKRLGHVS